MSESRPVVAGVPGPGAYTENTLRLEDPSRRPEASIEQIDWLVGTWRGAGFGGQVEECWAPSSAGSKLATFRLERDGRARFYEFLVLAEEAGSLSLKLKHFSPDLVGWEERDGHVSFPLVRIEPGAAYFHGLTYRLDDTGRLHIYMTLPGRQRPREVDLVLTRWARRSR